MGFMRIYLWELVIVRHAAWLRGSLPSTLLLPTGPCRSDPKAILLEMLWYVVASYLRLGVTTYNLVALALPIKLFSVSLDESMRARATGNSFVLYPLRERSTSVDGKATRWAFMSDAPRYDISILVAYIAADKRKYYKLPCRKQYRNLIL
jgi:hypothetical protein